MNKRNIALGIAVFFAAVIGSLVMFGVFHWPQLGACFLARKLQRDQPRLAIVPQPLTDTGVSQSNGMSFSRFGYEFEAPWKDLEKIGDYSLMARIRFQSGRFIMFYDPRQRVDRIKVMRDAAAAKGIDIKEVFGAEAMESNYSLVNAVLNLTPSQISVWMPAKEAIRDSIFLVFKQMEIVNAETGLFFLRTQLLEGFQKGDPSRAAVVVVDAFDEQDHEYEVWIGVEKGKKATVTQAEINKILQTLRPVAEATVIRERE